MRRAWLCLFVAVNIAAIATFWWWNATHGVSPQGDQPLMACGRMAGLLAAFCALLQLLFISRAPWIEQAFGFDHLTRLHKYNGFLVVLFVAVHGVMLTMHYAASRDETWSAALRAFATDQEGVLAAMVEGGLRQRLNPEDE